MANKITISLLGLLITIPVIAIAYFNFSNTIDILFLTEKITLPLAYLIIFALCEGIAAGFFFLFGFHLELQARAKEYVKRLEKTSISADSESSRVAVLEAKIEVLEKALKSALEQNN